MTIFIGSIVGVVIAWLIFAAYLRRIAKRIAADLTCPQCGGRLIFRNGSCPSCFWNLTWTCMVCGDRRPDAQISVYKRDISAHYGAELGTVTENIRYCNDRPSCVAGAENTTLAKHKPKEVDNGEIC